MSLSNSTLSVSFAASAQDVMQAQQLRYTVFVKELGAHSDLVDQNDLLESDKFDSNCDHLLLRDTSRSEDEQIVGTYRLMNSEQSKSAGYTSEAEFDLTPIRSSGKRAIELSRSCVHPDYRDGQGMFLLWQTLSDYVLRNNVDLLFGVASFWGTNASKLSQPLSFLHHRHLARPELRPTSRHPADFDLLLKDSVNKKEALLQIPSLIKAYLRLGGTVGQGAYVDESFGTTDVCMVVNLADVSERQRAIYAKRS